MITRVGMAPRAEGLTYTSFQEHWRSEHAGLAGELPGLRGYIQNHAVLGDGRPLPALPGLRRVLRDLVRQPRRDGRRIRLRALSRRRHRRRALADRQEPVRAAALTERRVLLDGDAADDSVKLLTFLPVDPRSTREALDERARRPLSRDRRRGGAAATRAAARDPGRPCGSPATGVRGGGHPLVREPRAGARLRATARSATAPATPSRARRSGSSACSPARSASSRRSPVRAMPSAASRPSATADVMSRGSRASPTVTTGIASRSSPSSLTGARRSAITKPSASTNASPPSASSVQCTPSATSESGRPRRIRTPSRSSRAR